MNRTTICRNGKNLVRINVEIPESAHEQARTLKINMTHVCSLAIQDAITAASRIEKLKSLESESKR